MIVEDEKLCRETLKELPWSDIDMELISEASGAAEAIMQIKSNPPDIIISDIEMDNGDGFFLAKEVSYVIPQCKIIFLTAYDKFEYIQKAMSYKACAFILKPINRTELFRAVNAAKEELEKNHMEQQRYNELLKNFSNCKYFLGEYFYSQIAENPSHLTSLFPICDKDCLYQVVVVNQYNTNSINQHIQLETFLNIYTLLTQLSYNVIPFYKQNLLTYIFCYESPFINNNVFEQTFDAALAIENYMKHNANSYHYTIAIGTSVNTSDMIPYSAQRAKDALKYSFSMGENEILYIDDLEPTELCVKNLDEIKIRIADNIKTGNEISVKKDILLLFDNIKENHVSADFAQRICFEIVILISIAMGQLGQNPASVFDKTEIWSVLKNCQSLNELKVLILEVAQTTISLINTTREQKNKDIIHHVLELIENSINSDISLQEMAKQVYISPCYLSSMFKQKTGMSFKSYVIQTKLNKAKELLSTSGMPIHKIASTVGYKSPQHFSHVFREHTGLLPTEYRNMHRIKNDY